MRPDIQRVYLQEIQSQCTLAKQSVMDMKPLVVNAHLGIDAPRFWYCLQAFLSAAANISKLLWPQSSSAAERGRELRSLLGVEDTSPLANRGLRNDIEHFDERLDTWAKTVKESGDMALYVRVIDGGSASTFGLDPARCFLYFDTSTYHITFAGREYEFLPISWAITDLTARINTLLTTNSPPVNTASRHRQSASKRAVKPSRDERRRKDEDGTAEILSD